METVNITPEIGSTIRNLRMEQGITAKVVAEFFNKVPSYITKFEKGEIKKIDYLSFCQILDYITNSFSLNNSGDGLLKFLNNITHKYDTLDDATKKIIMNLDDTCYLLTIDINFREHLRKLLKENNITIEQIVNKINANEDLKNIPEDIFNNSPINEWVFLEDNSINGFIKLSYSLDSIESIINGESKQANYITLEAIMYTIYKLIGETPENARFNARAILRDFSMYNFRNKNIDNKKVSLESTFDGLDPYVLDTYKSILTKFKIMLLMNPGYTTNKLDILETNLDNDLGFTFAFITTNLSSIIDLSKESKSKFLIELKELIKNYSENSKQTLDLYID